MYGSVRVHMSMLCRCNGVHAMAQPMVASEMAQAQGKSITRLYSLCYERSKPYTVGHPRCLAVRLSDAVSIQATDVKHCCQTVMPLYYILRVLPLVAWGSQSSLGGGRGRCALWLVVLASLTVSATTVLSGILQQN